MIRIAMFACLAGFVLAMPERAEAAFKGCYERVYDKRYLKKNKKQQVVRMRFQIGVAGEAGGPPELRDRIEATLKGKSIYRGGQASCVEDGDELECDILGDGGSFRVTDRGENSVRITNTSSMRFGNAESGDTVKGTGQNREFRLYRLSEEACP